MIRGAAAVRERVSMLKAFRLFNVLWFSVVFRLTRFPLVALRLIKSIVGNEGPAVRDIRIVVEEKGPVAPIEAPMSSIPSQTRRRIRC